MSGEPPFSREFSLRSDQAALDLAIEPSPDERLAVRSALQLPGLEHLHLGGTLARTDQGLSWRGRLQAVVVQSCVVTHAPVTQRIQVAVERRFVIGAAPDVADILVDPDADEIDYLDSATVDLGVVAVEELSLALDPYPRAPGADAVVARYAVADDAAEGPFAALARRRLDA